MSGFDHHWLLDECRLVLQTQSKASKPDQGYMAGALAGLSSALAQCQVLTTPYTMPGTWPCYHTWADYTVCRMPSFRAPQRNIRFSICTLVCWTPPQQGLYCVAPSDQQKLNTCQAGLSTCVPFLCYRAVRVVKLKRLHIITSRRPYKTCRACHAIMVSEQP